MYKIVKCYLNIWQLLVCWPVSSLVMLPPFKSNIFQDGPPPPRAPQGAPCPWAPHRAPHGAPFPGKFFSRLCRENFFPPSRPWGPHGPPPWGPFPGKIAANFFFHLHDRSLGIFRLPIARMKMILIPIESLYKKKEF